MISATDYEASWSNMDADASDIQVQQFSYSPSLWDHRATANGMLQNPMNAHLPNTSDRELQYCQRDNGQLYSESVGRRLFVLCPILEESGVTASNMFDFAARHVAQVN